MNSGWHKSNMKVFLVFLAGMVLTLFMGLLLAKAGEPQAQWFFCDILNLCDGG